MRQPWLCLSKGNKAEPIKILMESILQPPRLNICRGLRSLAAMIRLWEDEEKEKLMENKDYNYLYIFGYLNKLPRGESGSGAARFKKFCQPILYIGKATPSVKSGANRPMKHFTDAYQWFANGVTAKRPQVTYHHISNAWDVKRKMYLSKCGVTPAANQLLEAMAIDWLATMKYGGPITNQGNISHKKTQEVLILRYSFLSYLCSSGCFQHQREHGVPEFLHLPGQHGWSFLSLQ